MSNVESIDKITIRMYNTGSVGDCLLLLFQKKNAVTFSMLIDCGGINAKSSEISECVKHIKQTCGEKIDVLAVTHEHKDHMSGFNQARNVFDQLEFGQVWLSWVENENDPIASILKENYVKKLTAIKENVTKSLAGLKKKRTKSKIKGAHQKFQNRKANYDNAMTAIDFELGHFTKKELKGLKADSKTISDAMEYVKSLGKPKPKYKNPGEVISNLKGAEGIRFYVLGPPKYNDENQTWLKTDMIDDEMYHVAVSSETLKITAQRKLFDTGTTLKHGVSPFKDTYKMNPAEKKAFDKMYNSRDISWRQMEENTSESALALTGLVNTMINNTSLAIAIEFEASGKIILLPADAQSGNWLSWHNDDIQEKFKKKTGKTTPELLENVVFYKVGHHGSHNGTASVHGLDMMTHKDLVAFMTLIQKEVPVGWGGAKNFPAKELYKQLIEKTQGCVVRIDEGLVKNTTAVKMRKQLTKKELNKFITGTKGLYYEYSVEV